MEEKETGAVHEGQIVQSHPTDMAVPQTVDMALARAEQHIQKRRGLVKLIAKNIDPRDVVIYGKPPKETVHYAKNACKQILSWIEADILDVTITETRGYNSKKGPYIIFEATGLLVLPGGRRVSIIGSRATYDDFFGSEGVWTDGKKETVEKPLEEVDIPSVRLAAITNMWNHALEDAGLKPSLEELRGAGLDMGKASYVNFREKALETGAAAGQPQDASQPASQPQASGNSAPKPSGDCISEPQAKRLFAIAKNQGYTVEEYRTILYNEFNVQRDTEIKKSQYQKAESLFAENQKR